MLVLSLTLIWSNDNIFKYLIMFFNFGPIIEEGHMAELQVTVPHCLSQDEAVARLENSTFSDKISNLHQEWHGYSAYFNCEVSGSGISGTIVINPDNVVITVNLSFFQSLAVDQYSTREEIFNKVSDILS